MKIIILISFAIIFTLSLSIRMVVPTDYEVSIQDTIPSDSTSSNQNTITSDSLSSNKLIIIKREDWQAKMPVLVMKKHLPTKITLHHDGVIIKEEVDIIRKTKSLQNYSHKEVALKNGRTKSVWADVPYHYIIYPKGEIVEGRQISFAGDTNTDYNSNGHILIDIAGNFETQIPTKAQITSIINLCSYLCVSYNISPDSISGHDYYAKTLCPGKNLTKLIPTLRDSIVIK